MRSLIVACFLLATPLSAQNFIPLNDLGPAPYNYGYFGGLWEDGSNEMPADHFAAGMTIAKGIQPLDTNGEPSRNGKIVFLTLGEGDTARIVCAQDGPDCEPGSFIVMARQNPRLNPALTIIDATREDLSDLFVTMYGGEHIFDRMRAQLLLPAGVDELQVQAAWLQISTKHPYLMMTRPNGDSYLIKGAIGMILRGMKKRYPNLQIAYLSSRPYGGYSENAWNTEPFAYETGLSVRWAVMGQVITSRQGWFWDTRLGEVSFEKGEVPWIAWGPYMWANGMTPRSDGLVWRLDDFNPNGEFLSAQGAHKAATMLLDFMMREPTARPWFVAPAATGRPRAVRH